MASSYQISSVKKTLYLIALCSLFIACRTIPVHEPVQETFPLDSGALVYIFADVNQAESIFYYLNIEELANNHVRQMVERTDFAAAALFPPESGRRFQLAAWGNYPSSRANFAFRFSRRWRRVRADTGHYWHSASDRLSLSLTPRKALVNASLCDAPRSPVTIGEDRVTVPEGFNEFRMGAPFSAWLGEPAPLLNQMLYNAMIPAQFPVQQIFINLYPVEDNKYEAVFRLRFEAPSHAAMLNSVLSLAGRFMAGGADTVFAALFFANPPIQHGSAIDIRTAALSGSEISALVRMFSF